MEIRQMIFKQVINNHFDKNPSARVLLYRNDSEPWVTLPEAAPARNGLTTSEIPPLEVVLADDIHIYREFFALRIQMSTIRFEPSLAFDWTYESPAFSSTLDNNYCKYIITEIIREDTL